MKKTVVAATLAAVVASTTLAGLAVAQQSTAPAPQASLSQDRDQDRPRFSDADRLAFTDARIAGLKAGLKLTPDQEKLWPGVEAALRDAAKLRAERAAQWREQRKERRGQTDVDLVQRMRQAADRMTESAAQVRKLADAIDPLYKTLDESQKRRLSVLLREGRHHAQAWRMNAWHEAQRAADQRAR